MPIRNVIRAAVAVCALLVTVPVWPADADRGYLQELKEQARALNLAEERAWRRMVHYEPRRFGGGVRSDASDPNFFNAPNGRYDPEAELEATLEAFFAAPDAEHRGRHPQCAFIGRFHWLEEKLEFDQTRLPRRECSGYEEWKETIDAGRVALVFADAYMNNPASMFGHTLLRLDPPPRDDDVPLTSYVVNHAAATDETSGLAFAVRGVMGWYPGRFAVMPYYEKVREYNDLESRDLWEYRLNFSEEEMERMMRHLYEVDEISFPYYFFYKNCSYRLLTALEVARPELRLTERFNLWAIPTDTMRAVLADEGVLDTVVYRPSGRAELDARIPELTAEEARLIQALASGDIDAEADALNVLERDRRTLVLEIAYDYLNYRFNQRAVGDEARPRMHELLVARSRAETPAPETPSPSPEVRPDQGHGTARLGVGVGQLDHAAFGSLEWRAAYHDLLDPPGGYHPGAQVEFLDIEARFHESTHRLELERLMFVDVESLVPRSPLFQPWSWNLRGGFERHRRPDGGRTLMGVFEGGVGWTWQTGERLWVYTSLQGSIRASGRLRDRFRAGAGPRLDLVYGGDLVRMRLRAESRLYHDDSPSERPGFDGDAHHLSAEVAGNIGKRISLRLLAEREWDYDVRADHFRAMLYFYY